MRNGTLFACAQKQPLIEDRGRSAELSRSGLGPVFPFDRHPIRGNEMDPASFAVCLLHDHAP